MSVKDIYLKTMKFSWLKLAVGAAITLISKILLLIFVGIGALFGNGTILMPMVLIWLSASFGVYEFAMYYVGYMIKAAHIVFGGISGVSSIVNFVQIFIGIALGYVDEYCLGYTFYKKEEGAFKCGCDGVVIYYQNAKHLLKNAVFT
nr:hypothetical protein [Lachnospiraceae bacterium]